MNIEERKIAQQLTEKANSDLELSEVLFVMDQCEHYWELNLKRFEGKQIKYILIAEAPPASINGEINYFYKTFDGREAGSRTGWIRSIARKFGVSDSMQTSESLDYLAQQGFILIDSIPLPLSYTSNLRKSKLYYTFAQANKWYLIEKLLQIRPLLAEEFQVALAFKLNALVLCEIHSLGIQLGENVNVQLDQSLIITDAAGYPNAGMLETLWKLG